MLLILRPNAALRRVLGVEYRNSHRKTLRKKFRSHDKHCAKREVLLLSVTNLCACESWKYFKRERCENNFYPTFGSAPLRAHPVVLQVHGGPLKWRWQGKHAYSCIIAWVVLAVVHRLRNSKNKRTDKLFTKTKNMRLEVNEDKTGRYFISPTLRNYYLIN